MSFSEPIKPIKSALKPTKSESTFGKMISLFRSKPNPKVDKGKKNVKIQGIETRKKFHTKIEFVAPPEINDEQKQQIHKIQSKYNENIRHIQDLKIQLNRVNIKIEGLGGRITKILESETSENIKLLDSNLEQLDELLDKRDLLEAELRYYYRNTDPQSIEEEIMRVVRRADLSTTHGDEMRAKEDMQSEMLELDQREIKERYHKDDRNKGSYTLSEKEKILHRLRMAQLKGKDSSHVFPPQPEPTLFQQILTKFGWRGGKSKKRRTRKRRNSRCKI